MSIPIFKSASPHPSESQAKTVKYEATNLTSVESTYAFKLSSEDV